MDADWRNEGTGCCLGTGQLLMYHLWDQPCQGSNQAIYHSVSWHCQLNALLLNSSLFLSSLTHLISIQSIESEYSIFTGMALMHTVSMYGELLKFKCVYILNLTCTNPYKAISFDWLKLLKDKQLVKLCLLMGPFHRMGAISVPRTL